MAEYAKGEECAHLQDVMGSLPMLKRYVVLCLCFVLDAQDTNLSDTEDMLRDALARLTQAFPYLAGQVVLDGKDKDHTGIPRILPLASTIQLIVNDLRESSDFPSMANIREASYPFAYFDPAIVAPPIASTWTTDESGSTAPVFTLQANFVKGGLLLLVAGNHTIMDMTGMGIVIAHLAKACRGEPFSDEEVQQGNQSRGDIIPLFGKEFVPGRELDDVTVRPPDEGSEIKFASAPTWAYFDFKADALNKLKQEASVQDVVPYISTDDAISALCWQRISKVREPRLGSGIKSQFVRPISIRNYFGLKGYTGHLVDCATESEIDVWQHPIGEVAGRLRQLLREDEKIVHHARAFATMLDRLDDKSQLSNGALVDPTRDLVLSSYTNIKCCDLSFGPILGQPDAARYPKMAAWPSLGNTMPKSRNGDIAVALCLEQNDLDLLRNDSVFGSFAKYIG